jgi:cold shock protein
MPQGIVKWFNIQKGYGFIRPEGAVGASAPDVFVHISAIQRAGLTELKEGQVVEYDAIENRGSRSSAENLRIVSMRADAPIWPKTFRR